MGEPAGEGRTVRTVMRSDPPVAHLHETLERVIDRFEETGASVVAAVDGDKIATLVCRDEIEALLRDGVDGAAERIRDHFRPPVRYIYAEDTVAAARATLEADGVRALAVVDDAHRLVGAVTADELGDAPLGAQVRPPTDPTDRRHLDHPRLDVYAPWAVASPE